MAERFVEARRANRALSSYPGVVPATLEEAYAIQSQAVDLWGERVAGWKVGRIFGEAARRFGADRFLGPIFSSTMTYAGSGEMADFPCFEGGFAALEAEILAFVRTDQGAGPHSVSPAQARDAVAALHIGIEVAGSPLAGIDTMGPLASVAAFGNNAGLIIGPELKNGHDIPDAELSVATRIGDLPECRGDASALPGGIWTAVAFALETAAHLGRPMKAGDIISTGALTGVIPVAPGLTCRADFGRHGLLRCRTVPAGAN